MTCIVFSQFANVSNFPRWHDRLEIAVHNCTFPYFNYALKQSKRSLKLWHNTAGSCGCFCWHAPLLPIAIDGPDDNSLPDAQTLAQRGSANASWGSLHCIYTDGFSKPWCKLIAVTRKICYCYLIK